MINEKNKNLIQIKNVYLCRAKRGIAIFLVLGLGALLVPILYMFSQLSSSSTRQSAKFEEYQLTEQVATDAQVAMMSIIRGGEEYFHNVSGGSLGPHKYQAKIYKTGIGMIDQNMYYTLTQYSKYKQQIAYTVFADSEQYARVSPVLTNFSNYYGTTEFIDICDKSGVLNLQNKRGLRLLAQADNILHEQKTSYSEYEHSFMNLKSSMPNELLEDWDEIAKFIASEKAN